MLFKIALICALCWTAQANQGAKTLFVLQHREPTDLDWRRVYGGVRWQISRNTMLGLVAIDANLKAQPSLAKSWQSFDGNRKFRFHLGRGIKWSDGKELTADDFVTSWLDVLVSKAANPDKHFLYSIKGARSYAEGQSRSSNSVGITAIDPYTLEVSLVEPMAIFPLKLAHPVFYPARMDLIRKHGSSWSLPPHIVTLGPYKVNSWEKGNKLCLVNNERYFGEQPSIKNICIVFLSDRLTILKRFLKNELDVVTDVSELELLQIKLAGQAHGTFKNMALFTQYLTFNLKSPAVSDENLRRAIAGVIDKTALTGRLARDYKPAHSLIPPGLEGHTESPFIEYNPTSARQALSLSPQKQLAMKGLTLSVSPGPRAEAAQIIAQMILQHLGIPVKVQETSDKTGADMAIDGWAADFPHAASFLELFSSNSSSNRTGYANEDFDQLILSAVADGTEHAAEHIRIAQKVLQKDSAVVVPLFYVNEKYILSRRVKNFDRNRMGTMNFPAMSLSAPTEGRTKASESK